MRKKFSKMGLIFKIFPLLVICVLISAQEVEDSDRQSRQQFQRPTYFNTKPIRRIVERVGGRVKQGSSLLTGSVQSFLNNVRQRTQDLEESFLDQQAQLKSKVKPLIDRKRVLQKEERELKRQIEEMKSTFSDKVEQYKLGLQQQKDLVDKKIKDSAPKGSSATAQLKNESDKIDEMISGAEDSIGKVDPDDSDRPPPVGGIGDGYGRHLK